MTDHAVIRTPRLDLILLTPETIGAILSGRDSSIDGVPIAEAWVRESDGVLRRRLDQATRDPGCAPWLLRAMVHRDTRELVGRIGFHGAPGTNALGAADAVELGYAVQPAFRRQGFAEEAIRGLLAWAKAQGISRSLISVGPANDPSLTLAAKLGFAEVARVDDEEDGPEIVFELPI